jgi:hypothetical protein
MGGKGSGRKPGFVVSEETRRWQRKNMTGEGNPMYGLHGDDNPNTGKKRPEEVKKKISESMKKFKQLQKTKKKVVKKRIKK